MEGGLKPVQEGHGAAYAVKGQYTCHVVQVHTYPGGMGALDSFVHAVVPGGVTRVGAEETPGFVVVAQQTQWAFALPADAFVGNPDGELAVPLDFPVEAASGQGLSAQHLSKTVKPLWGFGVGLQVSGADDFSAAFWDVQLLVCCVGVQFQLAEVWRKQAMHLDTITEDVKPIKFKKKNRCKWRKFVLKWLKVVQKWSKCVL